MARGPRPRGQRDNGGERHEREREHERRPDRYGDRDHEESGDDPERHARIIERRWLGSPPPTLERYARALRQWHRLPGAVVRPATDVSATREPPAQPDAGPAPAGEDGEP
jgi:hypothetical protein